MVTLVTKLDYEDYFRGKLSQPYKISDQLGVVIISVDKGDVEKARDLMKNYIILPLGIKWNVRTF